MPEWVELQRKTGQRGLLITGYERLEKKTLIGPYGSDSKASACNVGDPGSIPGLGRSPGEGNRNPLQYSCLENSMDRIVVGHN